MSHNLTKQPSEKKIYEFPPFPLPAGAALASVQSVTIEPRGLVAEVAPLVYANAITSGAVLQITLEGGTDGEEYLITAVVLDSLAEVWEDDVELRIEDFTWSVPDGAGHIYITPGEYITRFGYNETQILSDTHDVGRIDKDRLGARLLEAAAMVDGYAARRYVTPIAPIPEIIKGIAADLTRFLLHGDNVPDVVDARHKIAKQSLKDISAGIMVLPAPEKAGSDISGAPDVIAPARIFNRDSLKGF